MNQRGLVPILIVLLIAGVVLFTPLPRYQQAMCNEMDPPTCYPASWKLSSSLWDELTGKNTQTVSQIQCKPCTSFQDTSCQGGTTCFIPESYSAGVCVPVPKMGQKYSIDQINNICGTSLSIDETADWETYRNKEFGYLIKYPTELTIEKALGPIDDFSFRFKQVSQNLYDHGAIEVYLPKLIPPNITIQEAIEEYSDAGPYKGYNVNSQKIIIDGVEGLITEVVFDFYAYDVHVIKNSRLYIFRLSSRDKPVELSRQKEIFYKMLSTFKFTN